MDLERLFKVPAPVSGKNKRKLPPAQSAPSDADEDDSNSVKRVRKEDDESVDDEDDRFLHGDGLSEEQRRIYEIVDAGEEIPEKIDVAQLKKTVLRFEKAVNKNQEQRTRFPDNPKKFMESEADLDEEIKAMLTLSSVPELFPHLVNLGTVATILSLIVHENTDICIATIELLNELTDEDVVAEAVTDESEEGMKIFVQSLVENQVFDLLVDNLGRLNEDQPEDKQGVFNTLGIIENIISVDTSLADVVVRKTSLLAYLLRRISTTRVFDSNRQYASELLSILLQNSRINRSKLASPENGDGVEALLRVIATYRKRDPAEADEVEMLENVFDSLCLGLSESVVKKAFLDAEGVELMLLIVKEKKMGRMRAMKVLNHALQSTSAVDVGSSNGKSKDDPTLPFQISTRFIEAAGLRTLFASFMHKGMKAYKKRYKEFSEAQEDEHIVSIIVSLFKYLSASDTSTTSLRLRLLSKFTEEDFEKVDRLVEMFFAYNQRVAVSDRKRQADEQAEELDEEDEDGKYLRRLDAGLFVLQHVALIIAQASCDQSQSEESRNGIIQRARILLYRGGHSFAKVAEILKEYAQNLGESADENNDERKEVLALADCVQSLDEEAVNG
ncbi:Catenin-beta-like protein [Cladochytrium replicatum]|nr:Catenin-beta-like protein [Cladochytrium replicatum]